MDRSAGILLLSGFMVAACATTPSPSSGFSEARPSSSPSAVISATPSAIANATSAPTSSLAPTSTPSAGAGGWPFTPGGSELVFGPDGTAYLLAGMHDAEGNYQQSLVALDAAGYTKPGWPIDEPPGSGLGSLAVGPDGSVYVGECRGPRVGCLVHRLGTDGRELPGWPSQMPPDISCPAAGYYCLNRLEFGPNGTAYLSLSRQVGGLQVIAIDSSGAIVPGWPVVPDAEGVWWSNAQVGSDGTLFILGLPDGSESPARLAAYGRDGSPRPGWPVAVPDRSDYILGPDGTVVVWSSIFDDYDGVDICYWPLRTVFTVLSPDGRTLPGWPRGSTGYASTPVVGVDGTVYVSDHGNVYAHDQTGEVKAVWPAAGELDACTASIRVAPDGTIYVLGNNEVTALSRDGSPRPGWPYRPEGELTGPPFGSEGSATFPNSAFGPDGTVYFVVFQTDATGVSADVVAVDRQGQVRAGWPYRWPIDPTYEVASLTVSPDGRLFIRGGNLLLSLDPDGRLSD